MTIQKSPYRRIKATIRKIAGWTAAIAFLLLLGKAGASDRGAPIEDIFPSTIIYCGIMIVSILIYKVAGGK